MASFTCILIFLIIAIIALIGIILGIGFVSQKFGKGKGTETEPKSRDFKPAVDDAAARAEKERLEKIKQKKLAKGTIHVEVKSVNGIPKMDNDGNSDPYVQVLFDGKKEKTKVVSNKLDADFNEKFDFPFDAIATKERVVGVEVWDHDRVGNDDIIGKVSVPFLIYLDNETKLTFDIVGAGENLGKNAGTITLSILYTSDE
ncbi:MAG: hypothetical protein EZS28_012425 [Streblomastix strix]|uniref:C2 domain-containing protein n=1 Tax=Streblomastix strix TaxID=222440 RepID=A0A5J4WAR8_9EUKA|nr:MAG: hypothetical protein EZS28_012425 [Streblomastix strix]